MNLATSIIISLVSISVIFFLLYILLRPTKQSWPQHEERICPRCHKSDYKMVGASNSGVGLILGIGNPHYVCNKCKFRGVFPIIDKEDKREEKNEL